MQLKIRDNTEIEIPLLMEAIYQKYGYDFRCYSKAHLKRRILNRLRLSRIDSISLLQHRILEDMSFAEILLRDLSINVTEMFRDPEFYACIRQKVVSLLKTWSFIKLWHAGCSTGEEVYSMAILLKEEGLYNRTQVYATDFNQEVIRQAKEGIYPAELMRKYAANYQQSGAKASFADYFHARYDSVIMDSSLKNNIVWAHHNLVTDSDFAETHVIICRNVLIYFNKELQDKVIGLFYGSLVNGGILCLGTKESLRFTSYEDRFEVLDHAAKIYRKKYQ